MKTGNALHCDAYAPLFCRSGGNVTDVKKNLYDGEYHKYSFLWTSEYYVFYVDGEAVWASDAGGVSKAPEYLRLTVEIRDGKIGPYAQAFGNFENGEGTDFSIKSVNVWQNGNYKASIKANSDWASISVAIVVGSVAIIGCVAAIVIIRRKKM